MTDDVDEGDRPAGGDASRPSTARASGITVTAGAVAELDEPGRGGGSGDVGTSLLAEDVDALGVIDAFAVTGAATIAVPSSIDVSAVLTQDLMTGRWRWHLDPPGPAGFEIAPDPVAADGTDRGVVSAAARMAVRVIGNRFGDRVLAGATRWAVTGWERLHRPVGLRWFRPGALLTDGSSGADVSSSALAAGRSLLFLHDLFGRSSTSFYGFDDALHADLDAKYGTRLWAYEHPTLATSPAANAQALLALLFPSDDRDTDADANVKAGPNDGGVLEVDIIAHGRGGLVAAALVDAAALGPYASRLKIGTTILAGTPLSGTKLCDPDQLANLINRYTNLLSLIPDNPITTTIDAVLATATEIARNAANGLSGVTAMSNPGPIGARGSYRLIAANHVPGADDSMSMRLADAAIDRLLDADNDLFVTTTSAVPTGELAVTSSADDAVVLVGHHRNLWSAPSSTAGLTGASDAIRRWLAVRTSREMTEARHAAEAAHLDHAVNAVNAVNAGAVEPAGADEVTTRPSAPPRRRQSAAATSGYPLQLGVLHAAVEYADHPVLAGHLRGSELTGAEGSLDARLSGRLGLRHLARRYPERIGEVLALPNDVDHGGTGFPPGVIIIGLDLPGALTRSKLTDAVAAGLLDHVLVRAEQHVPGAGPEMVAVSTMLIGTSGTVGLPIESSVGAIVDAALAVNGQLVELASDDSGHVGDRVRVGAIQFVERHADKAEVAARALARIDDLLLVDGGAHTSIQPSAGISTGGGAWPARLASDEDPGWQRVIVRMKAEEADRSTLAFTVIGSRAQVEELRIAANTEAVDALLQRTLRGAGDNRVAAALFELLVPRDLRLEVTAADNLQFIVDEKSAAYPWEAVVAARSGVAAGRPLSRGGGFIRQFYDTEGHRNEFRGANSRRALVIGNPPGDTTTFPSLPHAYEEASNVGEQLGTAAFDVVSLLWESELSDGDGTVAGTGTASVAKHQPSRYDTGDSSADVLAALTEEFRILHIAAHGEMVPGATPADPGSGGVVIGNGVLLTAADIEQRSSVPELVFLNCCNLGAGLDQAANLARAFMKRGAQAVIAAGWMVNDVAARAFADRFYRDMLAGETFGTAVQRARRHAFSVKPRSLTWAAYQCYGDPGYRLEASKRAASGVADVVSESEFVRQVKVLATDIGDVGRPDADRMVRAQLRYRGALDEMTRRSLQRWDSALVAYELGLAYSELGEFDAAIAQYERALACNEAHVPVRALEQLGNLQIRRAQQFVRTRPAASDSVIALPNGLVGGLVDSSHRNLCGALAIGVTGERLALLGSHFKKRATLSPARRDEWLAQSARYYWSAQRVASQPYHLLNFVQLFVLLHGHLPSRTGLDAAEAVRRIEVKLTIEHTDERHDFWGRNTLGDAALTRLIAGDLFTAGNGAAVRAPEPTPDSVAQRYRDAFALRSSWRERRSCLDHLHDVIDLCDPLQSDLHERLVRVRDDLTAWTRTTFGDQP